MNKYHARVMLVDGLRFASQREATRYGEGNGPLGRYDLRDRGIERPYREIAGFREVLRFS